MKVDIITHHVRILSSKAMVVITSSDSVGSDASALFDYRTSAIAWSESVWEDTLRLDSINILPKFNASSLNCPINLQITDVEVSFLEV